MKINSNCFKHELVGWQFGLATSDVSRFCEKLSSHGIARLPVWRRRKQVWSRVELSLGVFASTQDFKNVSLLFHFQFALRMSDTLNLCLSYLSNKTVAKHARKRHFRYTTDFSSCFVCYTEKQINFEQQTWRYLSTLPQIGKRKFNWISCFLSLRQKLPIQVQIKDFESRAPLSLIIFYCMLWTLVERDSVDVSDRSNSEKGLLVRFDLWIKLISS